MHILQIKSPPSSKLNAYTIFLVLPIRRWFTHESFFWIGSFLWTSQTMQQNARKWITNQFEWTEQLSGTESFGALFPVSKTSDTSNTNNKNSDFITLNRNQTCKCNASYRLLSTKICFKLNICICCLQTTLVLHFLWIDNQNKRSKYRSPVLTKAL